MSEARIIAEAGRPGAVTIATNMAGRGTDIVLGGNWQADVNMLDNPMNRRSRRSNGSGRKHMRRCYLPEVCTLSALSVMSHAGSIISYVDVPVVRVIPDPHAFSFHLKTT